MMVAGSAVQKFGTELDSHQQILMAASCLSKSICIESTILRTEKLAKKKVKIKYKSKLHGKIIFVPSGRYRYLKGKKVLFC
jgi:uncharacterized protein YcfL